MSNSLQVTDEALLALYKENADIGLEDTSMGAVWPILKLTQKGSENELADGQHSAIGKFYHTATKEQYTSVTCHILYINQAYLPNFEKTQEKLNYIVAGVMTDDFTPFVLFIKGKSLQPFWNFQKDVREYVKNPKTPVPLFALTVQLTSEKADAGKWGKIQTIVPTVVKNGSVPVLVTDRAIFDRLKEMSGKAKEGVRQMLAGNAGPSVLAEEKQPVVEDVPSDVTPEDVEPLPFE